MGGAGVIETERERVSEGERNKFTHRRIEMEMCVQSGGKATHDCPQAGLPEVPATRSRKVDIRLPGKGDSNSHGARTVHQNHRWTRTSRLSIKNSLSLCLPRDAPFGGPGKH